MPGWYTLRPKNELFVTVLSSEEQSTSVSPLVRCEHKKWLGSTINIIDGLCCKTYMHSCVFNLLAFRGSNSVVQDRLALLPLLHNNHYKSSSKKRRQGFPMPPPPSPSPSRSPLPSDRSPDPRPLLRRRRRRTSSWPRRSCTSRS